VDRWSEFNEIQADDAALWPRQNAFRSDPTSALPDQICRSFGGPSRIQCGSSFQSMKRALYIAKVAALSTRRLKVATLCSYGDVIVSEVSQLAPPPRNGWQNGIPLQNIAGRFPQIHPYRIRL